MSVFEVLNGQVVLFLGVDSLLHPYFIGVSQIRTIIYRNHFLEIVLEVSAFRSTSPLLLLLLFRTGLVLFPQECSVVNINESPLMSLNLNLGGIKQ